MKRPKIKPHLKKLSPRRRKHRAAPGSRPGTLSVDAAALDSTVTVIAYGPGPKDLLDMAPCRPEELPKLLEKHPVVWVNVDGLGSSEALEELGDLFGIHPLVMEDVVHVPQRPKVESYGRQLFMIFHLMNRKETLLHEQVSLVLGERCVVTFQERPGDPFEPVRERLRNPSSRLRQNGPDYLAYAILDSVVDHYFPVLDDLRDHLEDLEAELRFPIPDAVERIRAARSEVLEARRNLVPLKEVLRSLLSDDSPLVTESTRVFLRDCRDHVLEASEAVDGCRDIASGLMDIHLSTVSHQANQTMQVLTVIATIFMPLSFLAGIYGMNFDPAVSPWNMPELSSPVGYPVLLLVMALIGAGLLFLFWRKGWFD